MSRTNLLHWRTAFSVLPPCIHNTMQRAVSRAPPTTTTRIPSRALSSCDLPRPATRVSRRAALRNKSQSDSLTCAVPAWPRALRLMPWRSGGRGKRGPTTLAILPAGEPPDGASAPAVYEQDFFHCSIGFRPG